MPSPLATLFAAVVAASPASPPAPPPAPPRPPAALATLDGLYPSLEATYLDLHRNPELSLHEERTAGKMAGALRELGFDVTEKVGGFGVVGVLRNGKGPTVLVRTELDALPVKEETGLAHASVATAADAAGQTVPVMHACGHDLHMTAWLGAATVLSRARKDWRGTLVMLGQPAEEVVSGAHAMLADGLYTRFPKPDYAIAVHDNPEVASDRIAVVPGWAFANVNTVEVVVRGRGGHGAGPHRTVDPVVVAARLVTALQTLVSRETKPTDPAVVTVGAIHGGTKANVIPDEVKLLLTVRSYDPAVQKALLEGIERLARAEAQGARAPEPRVTVTPEAAQATWNDPALTERLRGALARALGAGRVVDGEAVMGAEDFGELGRPAGVPSVMLRLGATEPARLQQAKARGETIPPLHSARFAPDLPRALRTGVEALVVSTLELLGRP